MNEKVILASQSPRRKELMALLPISFEIKTKDVVENIDSELSVQENVCALAMKKATAIASEYVEQTVIGCDTVVVNEGEILGKPKDEADAYRMLEKLSGKTHDVYTGVSIINVQKGINESFAVGSKVTMKALSDQEIRAYIGTGEPMDKAGSYGIQGRASIYIQQIEGDYFNIVGLPVNALYERLQELQII